MIRALVALEWKRLKDRTIWSWMGISMAWREEPSFRWWACLNLVFAVPALLLDLSGAERGLVLGLGLLVLAAEMFNTAIERAVDRHGPEHHPLAGAAKDAASAGVALTAVAAGIAWVCILLERI